MKFSELFPKFQIANSAFPLGSDCVAQEIFPHVLRKGGELDQVSISRKGGELYQGEHGNHTNASAGYVGTNKTSGCESNWKYGKRDTVGSAGSNMSMSL
jgi:hypothetical protein